ncbi:protein MODIFIER OF SNC1 11-like [Punica granatum]|uniref:THO1-MOS11 C-terminal domain-containing protein n=2 Tax=Punica granatum TaxID=22663 RepID=A0A218VVK9_PUNGR|nr:protein MODIFIER OF SNC1 11-like [Punica granatum]OWM64587.1 hypothetical protein CDL15_Pgr020554 [Punica granatum]PKI60975.1 hypothetical protein CRG98_018605 [Punica granatum]
MAKVSINLNEKIPSEEDEVYNPTEDSIVGSSDPSPVTGTVTDHAVVEASVEPSPAPSHGSSGKALKEAEATKSTVAVIGSQAANGSAAPVDEIRRKIRRAERFGVPVQLSEGDKRNSRAERFGTGSGMKKPEGLNKSEELKRKARAERFGISVSEAMNEEEKKKAQLARFSSNATVSSEEEKRKARAIRFSNIPSPIAQANSKAAVAGGASGGA